MNKKQFLEEELALEAWREAYEESLVEPFHREAMEEARRILGLKPSIDEPGAMETIPGNVEDEHIHRILTSRDSMNERR
jgi:hypothetical protein